MTSADLSSGLPPSREAVLSSGPDVAGWTENQLFTPYDLVNDIGMWLHLGTVANVWELCEDRVLIGLPADRGVLSMWAYHRTAPSCRPAGANLAFECVEPFVEWPSLLKASACRSSYDATRTGALTDGPKSRVQLDLHVRALTPVWDAEAVPATDTGAAMAEQSWAREHYEQLAHAHGHLIVDSDLIAFKGHVWRDHSRGPRGADTLRDWRGHVIASGVMPSGCGFGSSATGPAMAASPSRMPT